MPQPSLELWFEFASTYSYLSVERIAPLAAAAGIGLEWRPFLLGPIFAKQGWNDSPFNIYPEKGRYMWRDMERLCDKYGIPFRRPTQFPRQSLLAARVACLVQARPVIGDFVGAVYRANFSEDRDIAGPETIGAILESLGEDAGAVISAATSAEGKNALRRQCEAAVELGIFGAPSFVAAGELFWGNDRLEDALAHARAVGA
ncbi:MAG TPA: 2-hydroxychromene-2-carboxylate isomerase [Candidatus Bathyarchaeia archaeon]|nr:2-hydroxychromene-2-carboxylate isomerase [Candidatus Bathyarchaeia archaeon]